MLGQGRPTRRDACRRGPGSHRCAADVRRRWRRLLLAGFILAAGASPLLAADESARLRIVWGAGAGAPQRWLGEITVDAGGFEACNPLGIEADEAAALRLVAGSLRLAPIVPRAFDGCDVAVRGEPGCTLTFSISTDRAPQPRKLSVALSELREGPYRAALDDVGGYLLVTRAPGDALRVAVDRDSMVFSPGEKWQLRIHPDLPVSESAAEIPVVIRLRAANAADVLWEEQQNWTPGGEPLPLEIACPDAEGAYRLEIAALGRAGLAHRLIPGQQPAALARRMLEFVVIDHQQSSEELGSTWSTVLEIDPANPRWWQRLPSWTKVARLPGRAAPRPLGNAALFTEQVGNQAMAALSATPGDAEPAWQAYTLPIRNPGQAHAVEIELPGGRAQRLDVGIIEQDAAGRAVSPRRTTGVYCDGVVGGERGSTTRQRIVFWPRTRSPVLLLSNPSPTRTGVYGRIRLLHNTGPSQPSHPRADAAEGRLVAAYFATPSFLRCFAAAGRYDNGTGLSITTWDAVLRGAKRLAQQTKAMGYNGAIVAVAADGAALTPLPQLGNSPRFDNGRLASDGADPLPKDVLEVLLRVFEREGLRLTPALQLTAPIPALESLQDGEDPSRYGVQWVNAQGRTWRQLNTPDGAHGPHYNLLREEVQASLADAIVRLTSRYQQHASLAGIALQTAGGGYGVLPGPGWGLDDRTIAEFERASGVHLPAEGPDRFEQRRRMLTGDLAGAWRKWQTDQLTNFYGALAADLQAQRSDLLLTLCTEQTLESDPATWELRRAVAGRGSYTAAFAEAGFDIPALVRQGGLNVLRPRRLEAAELPAQQAVDAHANEALALDDAFGEGRRMGGLFFHLARPLRLPSFDAQSPFGAANTFVSTVVPAAPSGAEARRPIVTAMAANDLHNIVEGASAWLISDSPSKLRVMRTIAQLPVDRFEMRTERAQPLTLRTYREADRTTLCLINEAPWPIRATILLETEQDVRRFRLGQDQGATADAQVSAGQQTWEVELDAYDLQAWRFDDPRIRVGPPRIAASELARDDLQRRIHSLDARMQSLDIRRPFPQLQDPSFELSGAAAGVGWQIRRGQTGRVEFDAPGKSGGRALRLLSNDAAGVAAQSHLFDAPQTGQLAIQAQVRAASPGTATLQMSLEYRQRGRLQRRSRTFNPVAAAPDQWTPLELRIDDLPLDDDVQLRVVFRAVGTCELWVDDVELFDLEFSSDERIELAKRAYAAKTALDEGKLLDCLRHLDSYWPSRLVEHVPPMQLAEAPPKTKTEEAPAAQERSSRWWPSIWR